MCMAVCGVSRTETEQLRSWIEQYCRDRKTGIELRVMDSMDEFWADYAPGAYSFAVFGLEDIAGFLAARRLREKDRNCRILLIADTDRYALQCVRLHVTDFILRPVTRSRLERGLDLLLSQR